MSTDADVGARLVEARSSRNMTRKQLAERAGFSVATVQHHENGIRGISRETAEVYCRILKISMEWLYTGRGDPEATSADPETAEIIGIIPRLDKARKAQLSEYARFLAQQKKR